MMSFLVCTGLLGILAALLTLNVSLMRGRKNILMGDGGDPGMIAAIRAQANLLELTPLCLLVIWLLQASYGDRTMAVMAIVLLIARLLHAGGMLGFVPMGRVAGAVGTTVLMLVASLWLALAGLGIRLY
jgi:uncharacterized protein